MRMTILFVAVLAGCGADKLATGGPDAAPRPDGAGPRPDGPGRPNTGRDGGLRPDGRVRDAGMQPDANPECRSPVEGQACASEGLICPGNCPDRCQFCNLWTCSGHVWTPLEAFPDPSCGRPDGGLPDAHSPDDARRPSPDAAMTCTSAGSATLNAPPVEISFEGLPCSLSLAEVARGVRLPYAVRITATTPGVIPGPSDAGSCNRPGPSGLSFSVTIEGNGQRYCLCDVGPCPPAPAMPTTLQPGSWPDTYEWTGRNWSGPSDTNNPMGAAFPPGLYSFTVSTRGLRRTPTGDVPFSLSASRTFYLTR